MNLVLPKESEKEFFWIHFIKKVKSSSEDGIIEMNS